MIYFLVSQQGDVCKIGFAKDVRARYRQHCSTMGGTWPFYAAICGTETQEKSVHAHFEGLRLPGTAEHFALRGELLDYIEWLGTRAWAACSLDDLADAYDFDGRWPWSPRHREQGVGQLTLDVDLLAPGVRKPRSRSERVLATIRSDSDEWYTPRAYVEAARQVMGSIDLDPASCPLANLTVKATAIYTQADDGLRYPWHGNVWLNPPYGNEKDRFVDYALAELAAGRLRQAVLCLNSHATDTVWFQPLWDYPVCLTHHRVRFMGGANGKAAAETAPTTGTAFVYLGPRSDRFASSFAQFGPILRCAHPATCTAQEFRERQRAGKDW